MPKTSHHALLKLTCELNCHSPQFLNWVTEFETPSHFLFGLYKIIISFVDEKIGYIIELPSHTCSESRPEFWTNQSWLGREERWEDGKGFSWRANTLLCVLVPVCYEFSCLSLSCNAISLAYVEFGASWVLDTGEHFAFSLGAWVKSVVLMETVARAPRFTFFCW